MSSNSSHPLPSSSFPDLLSSLGALRTTTMINSLPDDVLLEIFDIYRLEEVATSESSHLPWKWHRLAHVCQTWRDIIFSSSRHLNLELLCTYGTPVRKNLRHLPDLPIVIYFPSYFEDSDEDNLLAALEHPERVHFLMLHVRCYLVEKLATVMQKPFPVLKYLWLELDDYMDPSVLPNTFLGGRAPHLQGIYLDGIPFPAAPLLLLSALDLVDIDLRGLSLLGYTSPEIAVTSMATLPRLKYLTLEFPRGLPYRNRLFLPPTTRIVLPALTHFHFGGLFKYLEDFLVQIDTPQLDRLSIDSCLYEDDEDPDDDFQIPQLCKFIDRSAKLKPSRFRHADLSIKHHTIVIELWGQLSFELFPRGQGIGQVLSQISGMLSNVDRLFISSEDPNFLGKGIRWLELLRPFAAVKALRVQNGFAGRFAFVLQHVTGARAGQVLPALELLCLENRSVTPVKNFLAARQEVGCPVTFINKRREFQERLNIPPEADADAASCGDR